MRGVSNKHCLLTFFIETKLAKNDLEKLAKIHLEKGNSRLDFSHLDLIFKVTPAL